MQRIEILPTHKKAHNRKLKETIGAMGFFGPALLILIFVMLIPIVMVIYYSFFNNMIIDNTPFVGLKNYSRFFMDSDIWKMVRFTIIFTIGSIVTHLAIGLSLALSLNRGISSFVLSIFRAIFILPWVFTAAVSVFFLPFFFFFSRIFSFSFFPIFCSRGPLSFFFFLLLL
ncbi:MAG TPA: hypothetical protein DCK95_02695, partial [Anaerolineaceae bacterium]|nr:hypothetical protein [Anaerolineaceae bacterium]